MLAPRIAEGQHLDVAAIGEAHAGRLPEQERPLADARPADRRPIRRRVEGVAIALDEAAGARRAGRCAAGRRREREGDRAGRALFAARAARRGCAREGQREPEVSDGERGLADVVARVERDAHDALRVRFEHLDPLGTGRALRPGGHRAAHHLVAEPPETAVVVVVGERKRRPGEHLAPVDLQ